ncbi:arsenical resistance operon transcriptional repressor ArsD [Salipaludibacillus keqinensis]|uniref:Arsenical resistance operon transcriptional repressor ArsD n=1 Tax=Salipaludibacillus keqinensis TaxID=2045207 RepID=A0A323T9H1_9BACI|nr:arsenite efflux transporter metallochaperone ArsD [Salipaludibacillus keqinensis]PYZ92049.1 arsenical resistance operon transcriptional repressor ArsD [Salipaludibacillus keqinensis]
MNKKIEIFDPALCCPTGVCGPSVDPELTRISRLHLQLVNQGYDVLRYNLAQEPDQFANNKQVNELLGSEGPDALPAVVVDGQLAFNERYPSVDEFADWLGFDKEMVKVKEPKKKLNITLK